MSIVDKVAEKLAPNSMLPEEQQVDKYIRDRLTRSEARMNIIIPGINERYEMWRGNQYAFTDAKGKLAFLPMKTTPEGAGKRPWVSRSVQNLLIDIVQHEVSAVTQRIPSYEVTPTSIDPERRSAARTSEQVALYGYDKWNIRGAAVDTVTHAVVGQEGFAWPYFDTTVGPMIRNKDGEGVIGQGEIKIRVYGPQDVMWEPGAKFNDSPYHVVRSAQTMEAVAGTPGFYGGMIKADVSTSSTMRRGYGGYQTQLVEVYDYLELPCKSFPVGRWLTIANGRVISRERPYPTPTGICLFPLSYIQDPDNDRNMGLVQHLLDPQRVYNDAWNKIIEWKNLAINPQLFVAPGVLQGQKITNEPGAVYEIPDPTNNIRWREVPAMPQELFQILQETNGLIARLSAQNDIPQQVEAGRAIQTLIERDQARRQAFIAQVAEWHSHVATCCLWLVQQYYTEPRLLQIKGRWSPDVIKDFKGANLKGQIDVRVAPGSIEPRTKAAMEAKVLAYADRGWITPEQAMAAIEGGYAAEMVSSYELDQGRATRIIGRLKAGTEALYGTPEEPLPSRTEVDPQTGMPKEVPDFMPRRFDNIAVQKSVFEDWMKTEEFESLPPDIQNTAMDIYAGMEQIESDRAAQAQLAMQAAAQQAGEASAAQGGAPGGKPGIPDGPKAGDSHLPTPNQPPDQNRPPA